MEPRYVRLAHGAHDIAAAGSRRGDILTLMPDGRTVVLDTVVTHPSASTYVRRAAAETGFAAERAALEKHRNFKEIAGDGAGYQFVPLAMESYGRLGREAARFLGELGHVAAENGHITKAAFVRASHRRISCAIVRGNARVYNQAAQQIVRQGGRAYLPGGDVPVAECVD